MWGALITGAIGAVGGLLLYYRYRPPQGDNRPVSEAYLLDREVRLRRQGLDPETGEIPR